MGKKILLVLIPVLVAVAIVIYLLRARFENVSLEHPMRGPIVEAIYGLGKVKSRRHFEVKIGILSTVADVYVKEGDHVSKNTPLIKFLDSSAFRAPFDGTVTMVVAHAGESVAPQVPLLRVEDLKDKFIEVSLEQQGALRVQKGQEAEVLFESLRGEKLKGRVAALFAKNDEFLGHIEVEGLKPNVLPGMTADVAIIVGRHENALLVPLSSVNNGQVVVQRDGKNRKIPVKVGNVDAQWAEIIGGDLTEKDQIAVKAAK